MATRMPLTPGRAGMWLAQLVALVALTGASLTAANESSKENCNAAIQSDKAFCTAVWSEDSGLPAKIDTANATHRPNGGFVETNDAERKTDGAGHDETESDDDFDPPLLSFAARREARMKRAEESRKLQLHTEDVDRALLRVRTHEEVASIVLSRSDDMRHTSIRAALNHFAKRRVDWRDEENHSTKDALVLLAKKVIASPDTFPLDSYPRALHSFAELKFLYPHLYQSLATHTVENLDTYTASGIATSLRAFALSGVRAPQLFDFIAKRGVTVNKGTVSALPKLAWSYAVAKHPATEFFQSIATQAEENLSDMTEAEIESLLWAFATQGIRHTGLMGRSAEVVSSFCKYYTPSQLSIILWSYGALNIHAPELFDTAASEIVRRVDKYSAQDLHKVVWAFARLDEASPSVFQAVTPRAQARSKEFKPVELADVLWSFAKTKNMKDLRFVEVMAKEVVSRSSTLSGNQLHLCLWALNSAGDAPSVPVARASIAHQLKARREEFAAKDVSAMEKLLSK